MYEEKKTSKESREARAREAKAAARDAALREAKLKEARARAIASGRHPPFQAGRSTPAPPRPRGKT
jgi:hypothetical protein